MRYFDNLILVIQFFYSEQTIQNLQGAMWNKQPLAHKLLTIHKLLSLYT